MFTKFLDGALLAGGNCLSQVLQLVAGRDLDPFDMECSLVTRQLRADLWRGGVSLPMLDAMIASTALRHHTILVTGDVGFSRIPGLAVESY